MCGFLLSWASRVGSPWSSLCPLLLGKRAHLSDMSLKEVGRKFKEWMWICSLGHLVVCSPSSARQVHLKSAWVGEWTEGTRLKNSREESKWWMWVFVSEGHFGPRSQPDRLILEVWEYKNGKGGHAILCSRKESKLMDVGSSFCVSPRFSFSLWSSFSTK